MPTLHSEDHVPTFILKNSRPPHSSVKLCPLDSSTLIHLKQINGAVLPSRYSGKWYQDALHVGALAQLAFFDDQCVGAIRCAVDEPSFHAPGTQIKIANSDERRVYIMTLGVLAPFRQYGIATMLLESVLVEAKRLGIREVYVHAWTENVEAIEWYEKRGFTKSAEPIIGYYRKMNPQGDAYILSLRF